MIIGDGSIGKTCLLQRFNYDTFVEDHHPTIFDSHYRSIDHGGRTHGLRLVFHFLNRYLHLSDGNWRCVDTSGQEDYERLRHVVMPKGKVVLIAFSMVNRDSFDNIKTKWLPEKKKLMPDAKVSQIPLTTLYYCIKILPDIINWDQVRSCCAGGVTCNLYRGGSQACKKDTRSGILGDFREDWRGGQKSICSCDDSFAHPWSNLHGNIEK